MDFAETTTGVAPERFVFFTVRCDFNIVFDCNTLVLDNGTFSPPTGFALQCFDVGMLISLEDFSRYLTPMLGGDRFFNVFFVRFWV